MTRRLRDAGIAVGMTVVLLLGAESALRWLAPQDFRTEFVDGHSLAVPDSVLGHRLRPGAVARLRSPEFAVEYVVNASGLRGAEPLPDRPFPRILVVGDSFAFGAGLKEPESWAAVLRKELARRGQRMEVLNAGVPGYDTRSEVLALEQLLPRYQPDLVLLNLLPNDLFTNQPLAMPPSQEPPLRAGDKSTTFHLLTWLKRRVLASDALYCAVYTRTGREQTFRDPPSETYLEQVAITQKLLTAAAERCARAGARLVVVSIPQQFQVLVGDSPPEGVIPDRIDRDLGPRMRSLGVDWIDTLPALSQAYRSQGIPLFYRFDGHLNSHGAKVVGEHVASALAAEAAGL